MIGLGQYGCEVGNRSKSKSDTQKNLAAIKEASEQYREHQAQHTHHENSGARRYHPIKHCGKISSGETRRKQFEGRHCAAGETQRELIGGHVVDEVKRDGIRAEPDECRCPAAEAPDIDDLMRSEEHTSELQ